MTAERQGGLIGCFVALLVRDPDGPRNPLVECMTGPWPGNDRADEHRREPESAVPPPRPDPDSGPDSDSDSGRIGAARLPRLAPSKSCPLPGTVDTIQNEARLAPITC